MDRAPIHRTLWLLVTAGLLGVALVATPSGSRAGAQSGGERPESVACPMMTDSVNRLFLAFFNRTPDGAEFRSWTNLYRTGHTNLEEIATSLAVSDEFRTRYGELDARRYVELVYRNVLRREPTPEDLDFWVTNLESGYGRGSMMMAFVESEEFVRRTGTATPLSGYLRWYPQGTHWYCGVGSRANLGIIPLADPTAYADFMFHNGGDSQTPVGLSTLVDGATHVILSQGSLPPGFTSYRWGGLFEGDGDYGSALSILANEQTSWIAVFYPSAIGEQRLGWQIER